MDVVNFVLLLLAVQVQEGYPDAWIIVLLMPKSVQWVGHPHQDEMYGAYSSAMERVASDASRELQSECTLLRIIADKHIEHLGCRSHPDAQTHRLMAEELADAISGRLQWPTIV